MSRDLTEDLADEFVKGTLRPALFVEAEFGAGAVRFWSGIGELSWNGETWTGAGGVLAFSPPDETMEHRAAGGTITLQGISSDILSAVIGEAVQGAPVKAWLGAFDESGDIIADPYQWLDGELDVPSIEDSGETCTISVSVENRLQALLERAPERRYTPESHAIEYPGDKFFEFVPKIQDVQVPWGRK